MLLLFVANDQWARFSQAMDKAIYERAPVVKWLLDHSDLFRAAASRLSLFNFGQEAHAEAENRAAFGANPMAEGLQLLAELTAAQGSRLVVALWPIFRKQDVFYHPFLFPKSDPETMVIERLASKLGIATHRLDQVFLADLRAHDDDTQPVITRYTGGPHLELARGDGMHPNARASRLAAESLRDLLAAHPPRSRPCTHRGAGRASPKLW